MSSNPTRGSTERDTLFGTAHMSARRRESKENREADYNQSVTLFFNLATKLLIIVNKHVFVFVFWLYLLKGLSLNDCKSDIKQD